MESGERLRRGCGVSGEKISCGAMRVRFHQSRGQKDGNRKCLLCRTVACDWLRLHRAAAQSMAADRELRQRDEADGEAVATAGLVLLLHLRDASC